MSAAHFRRLAATLGTLVLVSGGIALTSTPASAADLGSASTEAQLVTLITTANGDASADIITLTGSGFTLTGDLPVITAPLTILGPGSGAFVLDAAGYSAFDLASSATAVTITRISISNAGTSSSTSAIRSNGVDVALDDIAVVGSFAGFRFEGGSVTVTHSSVSGSTGDGVYLDIDTGSASFDDVDFSSNALTGFYANLSGDAVLTVSHATVDLNTEGGVAVDAYGSATADFTGTTVTGTSSGDGIHVYAQDSAVVSFIDTTVSDNASDGVEAAVQDNAALTMTQGLVSNSGADGLDLETSGSGTITIDGFDVVGSGDNGLEFWAADSGSITTSNSSVSGSDDVGAQLSVLNSGAIDIRTSTIHDNGSHGVSISSEVDSSDAVVTITDTTIRDNGNELIPGGGIFISDQTGTTVVVANSTISGNTASDGGGIFTGSRDDEGEGEGAGSFEMHLTVINSTISGNVGEIVGGVYVDGDSLSEDSTVTILNSTITDNTVTGDGPAGAGIIGGLSLTIRNSIFGGNVDLPEQYGDLDFDGLSPATIEYTLVQTPSPGVAAEVEAGTGNITGVDPRLGPLADNGGPTFTHLLLDASPALNAGEPGFTGLSADQRGLTRVVGTLDMGAVEMPAALAVTGADAVLPVTGGVLVLGAGILLVAMRRRLAAR
ncbi:MAG TPA: right-handed parallel beta-helix repeat-containing protein [Terrimesophilobacter sp.]|nr:right-handed parallel beta-helix repeat-containing protein [Terrimesophilobacter sp.]